MADAKISALPASTTPLAGTEVLPVVQSGVTKQVSVANLTAGRNVTTGNITAIGAANANASFILRTNASNDYTSRLFFGDNLGNRGEIGYNNYSNSLYFLSNNTTAATIGSTGNVTVNTGNLVIGTSGKGIDFSATPGTGTSELLADYEEGTWTPVVTSTTGTITTVGAVSGTYVKVGSQVTVWASVAITANGTGGGSIAFSGLPFTNSSGRKAGVGWNQNSALTLAAYVNSLNTTGNVLRYDAAYPVATGESFIFTVTYSV